MKFKLITVLILTFTLSGCLSVQENEQQESLEQSPKNEENETKEIIEQEEPTNSELPTAPLQKHDEGSEIILLKENLEAIGYTINEEPLFDETTTWAITDFQLQTEGLLATGVYNELTKEALQKAVDENVEIEAGKGLPPMTEEVFTASGSQVLENPYDILALVNKENALPADYEPNDLVVPDVRFPFEDDLPKKQLRADAAEQLETLFDAAEEEGHFLFSQSGYRSYERQEYLFANYASEHGEEEANVFSARAGESEHQTGLTMDITSESVAYRLVIEFGETPEGQWVKDNAHHYGFIIRYPEGKEDITLYQFEPWHLRYVGEKTATEIAKNEWTLEEYYEEVNSQ